MKTFLVTFEVSAGDEEDAESVKKTIEKTTDFYNAVARHNIYFANRIVRVELKKAKSR